MNQMHYAIFMVPRDPVIFILRGLCEEN